MSRVFLFCSALSILFVNLWAYEAIVALRLRNVAELERRLYEVSDPSSPAYGRFLTREDIRAISGVSGERLDRVVEWMRAELGAVSVRVADTGDSIVASIPDEQPANKGWKVPEHVSADVVSVVFPSESKEARRRTAAAAPAANGAFVGDPVSQRRAYGIPDDLVATNKTNKQMVWGTGTYGYLESDMKAFFDRYHVPASVSDLSREGYRGTPGGDNFGEATLDMSYAAGVGAGVPTVCANTNNSASTETSTGFGPAFLKFLTSMSSAPDSELPYVLSLSLGSLSWDAADLSCRKVSEVDPSLTYADCKAYLAEQRQVSMFSSGDEEDRISAEFLKLGLRGVTIVAATGDGGSHFSFIEYDSSTKMGRALNEVSCKYNMPTFPTTSPYVLGVGGTTWSAHGPEKPVHWPAGGGGFSWRFDMPEYQKSHVEAYLKAEQERLPPEYSFDRTKRAYPDVSALSDNTPMIDDGQFRMVGGTSASTPSWAGVLSLINDHRLNKGLPQLGFVNTRLYKAASEHPGLGLFDVTEGDTRCACDGFCCDNGFPAARGWDAATGLGAPRWEGLLELLGDD